MIRATIKHETDDAILVRQGKKLVWIPKSVIPYIKRHPKVPDEEQQIEFKLPRWKLDQTKLEDE